MARVRVPIGSSNPQKKHLDALVKACKEGQVTLFVGAGVSIPYGLPSWEELITGLLLSEDGGRFKNFYPNYRAALSSWMARNLDFSPVTLGRVYKYKSEKGEVSPLSDALQKRLYANFEPGNREGTLLCALVDLVQEHPGLFPRIVNLNFDDLLVTALQDAGLPAYARYRSNDLRPGEIAVLHPHGFVPRPGQAVPRQEFVFTEDEYNRLTLEPFHWAATELASQIHSYRAFFVGLSMQDPNLRRILDAAKRKGRPRERRHFLMRRDYSVKHFEIETEVRELRRLAKRDVERRFDAGDPRRDRWVKKTDDEVRRALRRALRQAHEYDRQLFKHLGVNTFWVEEFADMPKVVEWLNDGLRTE